MNVMKRIFNNTVQSLAAVCVLYIVFSLFFENTIVNVLYALAVCSVVGSILEGILWFGIKGDSYRSRWIRRAIFVPLLIAIVGYVLLIFECYAKEIILMAVNLSIIPIIVFMVVAYIVDDMIENKKLKEINNKLLDNEE